MKVYVGGALGDEPRARRLMRACVTDGHELTLDWTTLPVGGSDCAQREQASAMRTAVLACEVFVLADHLAVRGALVELGIALAAQKPAVICAAIRPSVFFTLAGVHHTTHDDDLVALLRTI